ncbi:MAG: hypothetical protein JW808_07505, partial [Victivallales bacterium]|nr:hypothetical protein [Victivallales bacterium]
NSRLQFFFYTKTGNEGYFISMFGNYCELERISQDEGLSSLDSFDLPELDEWALSLDVFASRHSGQIIVSVNDKILSDIKDHDKFAGTGGGLAFLNMARGDPVEARGIRISPWDGRDPRQVLEAEPIEGKDQIFLTNLDRSSGELLGIEGDKASFKSEFGTFDIPVKRIKRIVTDKSKQRTAKRNSGDVRAFLAGNAVVTIDIESLSKGKLSGKSENFGKAEFSLESLERLVFGIYDRNLNDPEKPDQHDKAAWDRLTDPDGGINIDLQQNPPPEEKQLP